MERADYVACAACGEGNKSGLVITLKTPIPRGAEYGYIKEFALCDDCMIELKKKARLD